MQTLKGLLGFLTRGGHLVTLLVLLATLLGGIGEEFLARTPMLAVDFPFRKSGFRKDGDWLAVKNPGSAAVTAPVSVSPGVYDVTLYVVAENDGRPTYEVLLDDRPLGRYQPEKTTAVTEEGDRFSYTWNNVEVLSDSAITVQATTDAESDDVAWGRWSRLEFSRLMEGVEASPALRTPKAGLFGELQQWHRVTLAFEGPASSERANPNPFLDYRLDVTFMHPASGKSYRVPGYFAADGFSAETGGQSGNIWRAHFSPDEEGLWHYKVSFRKGDNIAVHAGNEYSEGLLFDGETGSFEVTESDKSGRDFRGKGWLIHDGGRYLRFKGNQELFLKGGADSPENFLAYEGFDGPKPVHEKLHESRAGEASESPLHRYAPHIGDWNEGDPIWRNDKGKGIVGALNYLSKQGMNSVYFLTMNVTGDGNDVWPWTRQDERFRFDCSKLDQWEIVFEHMDRLGLKMHVVTQETENDQLLDSGANGLQRRLYYRELIARFGHHPALVWNLGEENTNTTRQRVNYSEYLKWLDPYDHPVVVHTYPNQYDQVYEPLLGLTAFDGPSLQMGDMTKTHAETLKWVKASAAHGHPWFVSLDEIGPAHTGVKPDADDSDHLDVVRHALWGNLMAGGGGVEWYFGYQYAHHDLNCEDWRSREKMWRLTRIALDFFGDLPDLPSMQPSDELVDLAGAYCLSEAGKTYVLYLPNGTPTNLDLRGASGSYRVRWFNPRRGGARRIGNVQSVKGGAANVTTGAPPYEAGQDWVVILDRESAEGG